MADRPGRILILQVERPGGPSAFPTRAAETVGTHHPETSHRFALIEQRSATSFGMGMGMHTSTRHILQDYEEGCRFCHVTALLSARVGLILSMMTRNLHLLESMLQCMEKYWKRCPTSLACLKAARGISRPLDPFLLHCGLRLACDFQLLSAHVLKQSGILGVPLGVVPRLTRDSTREPLHHL